MVFSILHTYLLKYIINNFIHYLKYILINSNNNLKHIKNILKYYFINHIFNNFKYFIHNNYHLIKYNFIHKKNMNFNPKLILNNLKDINNFHINCYLN